MIRVAILRCAKLPSFVNMDMDGLDGLFEEDEMLLRGFEAQGVAAEPVVWSNPKVDWNRFDTALIRSTWDYIDEPEHFQRVLSRIEASSCRLFNPLEAVRWNLDKHYLFDLEKWGVPVIPTYRAADFEASVLTRMFAERQWHTAVLKPVVGLGASYAYRVPLAGLEDALEGLGEQHAGREYFVQPYLDAVVSEGEWSFVYIDHQLSHVLLKKPAQGDYRVQGIYGGSIQIAAPDARDLRQAEEAAAALPFDYLFARLDFIRMGESLRIVEVELIEPILSFDLVPESVGRLVHAARQRVEKG